MVAVAWPAWAQTVGDARELYASAAFEQALALLDRLKQSNPVSPDTALFIEKYRAFCLLALDRKSEAEEAIEAVCRLDPLYCPQEDEAAPWVRAVFREVRRRVLPSLVQQQYLQAKAAYDRKDLADAVVGFRRVLTLLDDPDLSVEGLAVSDLRVLAEGFSALSEAALRAATPAQQPPAPPVTTPPPAEPPPQSETPARMRIYSADDRDVTPPVPLIQEMPRWPVAGGPDSTREGIVEIVVTETGAVESAVIRRSVDPFYDSLLLQRTRSWRYRPAMRNGEPVKYRRLVKFVVARG